MKERIEIAEDMYGEFARPGKVVDFHLRGVPSAKLRTNPEVRTAEQKPGAGTFGIYTDGE